MTTRTRTGHPFRKLAFALAALMLLFALSFPLVPHALADNDANSSSSTTVRVGYYSGAPSFFDGTAADERKSGFGYDYLMEIAPYAGWNYEYVYSSRDEAIQALRNGEVDLLAGIMKTPELEAELLYSDVDMGISNEARYFVVRKDRSDLMQQLNDAQALILEMNPRYPSQLWQTYYGSHYGSVELSDIEKRWLEEKGTLKMGYLERNLPITGCDENGNPAGVTAEMIAYLQNTLGITIEPQSYVGINALEADLLDGKIDVIFPVYYDTWLNETKGLYQSDPIVDERIMVAYQGEYNDNVFDRVAISQAAMGRQAFINQRNKDSEILTFENRTEAFEAVFSGKATCTLGCASVMQRFMAENTKFKGFNIAYLDGSDRFAFAVSDQNPTLAAIISKSTQNIDTAMITDAILKYSYVETPFTIIDVIREYSMPLLTIALIIIGCIVYSSVAFRRRVKAFNKEQAETRAALEEALDSADNASAAKTSFLSNMSHDIRTPLNGIIGMTAIAAANIDDKDRVKDCLAKITSSGKHLLALINEILDVSKIESGKVDLNEEDFNLAEMMNDLMTINKPLADQKKQRMLVRVKNVTHERVAGDRVRLQQVITNLVSNAIKYTPEGGTIDVDLVERPSGSPAIGCYDFIVKDNGIGMSADYLPHLFEAFSRADDRVAHRQQGTGLGMPIALNIVRMMNGDIKVESELGKGSTFTATVFLKLADEDAIPYEEFIDLDILVVDDDIDVCESTCLVLSDLGMKCEYVQSGREAIDLVVKRDQEGHDYFAIIVDWVMPEMDGIETIKEIRRRIGDHTPIVVISAYDWSEIEVRAREAGAQYFVGKPLFKSRLTNLFAQILGMEEEPEAEDLKSITGKIDFTGKRALLAEDNDLNAEVATEFLGMTGLEIHRAINGAEAVAMVTESEPGYFDCVYMDIQMPIMNGYDAARKIRELHRDDTAVLPIFAMTADAFVDDVHRAKEAGMNEHLSKPLDFDAVIQITARYILL